MEMTKTENKLTVTMTEDELKTIVAQYLSFKSPYEFKSKNVTLNVSMLNRKGIVATAKGVLK